MNSLVLLLGFATYASALWAAMRFFRVVDRGARSGKRIITICAGTSTLIALLEIYRAPPIELAQALYAIGFYSLSLLLFWWSLVTCNKAPLDFAFSTRPPRRIVATGPYRYIRHPFYSSYILGWLAAVIAVPKLATFFIFVGMKAIYWQAAAREEQLFLASPLSTDYERYRMHTGLFLPLHF